ncbi:MAG: hypothetical protein HYV61_02445 [Candidatus Rokubacteria bacterium]|nr:hypothetical protein [Candidatus Rokubacteria bacterium]
MNGLIGVAVLLAGLTTNGPDVPMGPGPRQACAAQPSDLQAVPEQNAVATLDLKSLENRLRETRAIGFFTKLSLKNQVDDLVGRFRRFHADGRATLEDLRERYNLLFLKVLSLLQDDDPKLFRDITASREAIWDLLADPVKFRNLSKEAKS